MATKMREQLRELPNELRAYIAQQVSVLAPFCLPDSGVSVLVEKETEEDSSEIFFVTVKLTGDGAEVKSTSENEDVYKATRDASQALLDHLHTVQRQMIEEAEKKVSGSDVKPDGDSGGDAGSGVLH